MAENKNIKVLSGPKPWDQLTAKEREALKRKHAIAEDTKK